MTPDGLAMGESFVTEDDGGGRPVRRHLPVIADVVPVVARAKRERPRTLSMRRQSKRELERLRALYPGPKTRLPTSRGECQGHDGPCPLVSCKHHLYLDVNPRNGNIKLNFPGLEVWEMPETCALDVADRGDHTLEEVGALVSLTRERVRQVEERAFDDLKGGPLLHELLGIETVQSRGEFASADDGSGARTELDAIDGLVEITLTRRAGYAVETDGPTVPGGAW